VGLLPEDIKNKVVSKRVDDSLRIRGFKGARIQVKSLKNYKELKVWQKS